MVPTLPYDIWCLIAKYIPETDLLKLFSVNGAFFDFAMNKQYREVLLDDYDEDRVLAMGPVVLKRVRSLILHPLYYHKFSKPETRTFKKLKNYLKTPSSKEQARSLKLAQFQTEVQRRIEQMPQLSSLTIGEHPSNNLDDFISVSPLIQTAWMAHGDRLTSLTLRIPLEAFALCQPIPLLSALTELHLGLLLKYNTTFYEDILVAIAEFIGLYASSLTKLSIDTTSSLIDPSNLFSNIPQFPHLTSLSLALWLERLGPQYDISVDRFLEMHATSLTELNLKFWGPNNSDETPSPDVFFSSPIFQVDLPSLKTLDLVLCRWGEDLNESVGDNIVQYLRRFNTSLNKLSIRGYILTYDQVKDIVGVFNSETSQLHSLEMDMYFLSGTLLDLLYKQLPNLRDLSLRFDALLSVDDGLWTPNYYWNGYNDQAIAFFKHMEGQKYPDWGLRRLTVKPLYFRSDRWNDCRTALLNALPSTILINEV